MFDTFTTVNDQHSVGKNPTAWLTSSRWQMLIVGTLALVLRLTNLGGRPFWYDEAFAVLYAEKPLATMLYGTVTRVEGAAADVHPLFFYSTLHAWMLAVGQSPIAVRALSVLGGTATVVMAYLLARRLFDQRVALASACIVAVAPFHVYYSQEARMYAILGFAAMTMTYLFVRAWADGGWGSWFAFGVFGALTLYAHNLGFMFLAGLDLWVLWAWLRPGAARWRNFRPFVLSHLLIIGLFTPWAAVVPSQFGKIQQAYWVEQPGIIKLIQTVLIFHFAYDNQSLPGWLLPPALFMSVLLLSIISFELIRQRKNSDSRRSDPYHLLLSEGYSLLISLTVGPVLLTFLVSQIQPVYVVRALLPSALMYYGLVASVLVRGPMPKPIRWGLLLPSVLIVAASLAHHYSYAQFPRPPFKEVARYLRTHYQPADVIIHSNKLSFLPTYYYDRSLPQAFIADEPGSPSDTLAYPTQQALGLFASADIATATLGHERVWFVIFRRAIDEYRAADYPDHPQRVWLEQHYTLVSVTSFNDLDVYEYQSGLSPTALLHSEAFR
jgi:4-amino-4-deoxy-L-arabinose transferase-like glycosyltransferase